MLYNLEGLIKITQALSRYSLMDCSGQVSNRKYCLLNNFMEQIPSWEANHFSASQELSTFYETRSFITAFTNARQLSLSWARSIQSIPPHLTSWRSILILSSHLSLGLPSGRFPSGFLPIPCIHLSSPPFVLHDQAFRSSRFYHPNNIGRAVQIIKLLFM